MTKIPTVIWVVAEMIPDANGLDDVMVYLFRTEQEAKKAATRISEESDSDVEHFSMSVQDYATWEKDFEASMGEDEDGDEEED